MDSVLQSPPTIQTSIHSIRSIDLIDRVPEELQTEVHNTAQAVVTKTIPKKKKCNKAKWLSGEALQIAVVSAVRFGKTEAIFYLLKTNLLRFQTEKNKKM